MIWKIFSFVQGKHGGGGLEDTVAGTHFDQIHACKKSKFMLVKHQKFLSKPKTKIFASLLKQRWGDQICHNYIDFDIYIYIDIDVDINIDIVKGIDIDIDIGIDNDIYICNYIDINIDIDISLKIFYRKTGTC